MKKILIIEDDIDLSETVSIFLKSNKFLVYTAQDGVRGVQEAIRVQPDVIVCDISMPNLDGYGVYETLRHINTTSFIPFLFLTAKADAKDIRKGMNLGADDYITKPFDNGDLLEAIHVRIKKYETLNVLNERKLLKALDNPINGMFICQNKKIIYSNTKLSEILGYQVKEIVELSIEDFINRIIAQKDRGTVLNYFQKATGKESTLEIIRIAAANKKNEPLQLDFFIKSFFLNDKDTLVGYVIDITGVADDDDEEDIAIKSIANGLVSNREKEVLILICQGLVNKEIADKLNISKRTVDRHRDNLMKKTSSRNTAELMMHAIKLGLVEL